MKSTTEAVINRRDFLKGAACVGPMAAVGVASAAEERAAADVRPAGKDLGKARTLPPGRYDEHIHIYEDGAVSPEHFAARIAEAGLAGGCVYSREQYPSPRLSDTTCLTPEQIVDNVIEWCSASPTLYPFYWIDPSRPDAVDLVDMAVEKGIYGFKVIRNNGYPCDGPALECYRRMAHWNKPLTFHSGILYDGIPSSEYFRPVAFEGLLRVPGIRFALAHISWPWCDECIAMAGKMHDAAWRLRSGRSGATSRKPGAEPDVARMFVDSTPGAHDSWRRDAFAKIYGTCFRKVLNRRLMFGSDCSVHDYRVAYSRKYQDLDDGFLRDHQATAEETDAYYRTTLQSYLFGLEVRK